MMNNNYSQRKMASEFKCSQSTIRWWLKKFKLKNKKKLSKTVKCKCGEIDLNNFYGCRKSICKKCFNEYTIKRGQERRIKAINILGSKCKLCKFDNFTCSLDFHHINPLLKDPNFDSMRNWSWKRIEKEIKLCILLCKNCHAAVHSNHILI